MFATGPLKLSKVNVATVVIGRAFSQFPSFQIKPSARIPDRQTRNNRTVRVPKAEARLAGPVRRSLGARLWTARVDNPNH